MKDTLNKLEQLASATPSRWRSEAEERQTNKAWLRYSQMIALKMLDKMEQLGLTQKCWLNVWDVVNNMYLKYLEARKTYLLRPYAK